MARVLVVIPYYGLFPPHNGGQLRSFYLLRELAREHQVHAIILQPEKELLGTKEGFQFPESVQVYGPAQSPPPRTLFDRLPGRLGPSLHYRWLQRSWRGPANSVLLQTYHLVRQILVQHGIDLMICTTLSTISAASFVRRLCPQVIRIVNTENVEQDLRLQTIQGHDGSGNGSRMSRSAFASLLWHESNLRQFVHAFFACSEIDLWRLRSINKSEVKGFLVPNGVDTSVRPFDDRPGKNKCKDIVFCGSLDYSPNRDGLAWFHREIWPLIVTHNPTVRLVVVGRGVKQEEFGTLRSDPTVEFVGHVDDVVPYYRRTGIAVVPLRMGSGTRLKVLEAMSLGNPIVSTRMGALGIDAVNGDHLILADEPDRFAESIRSLLANADSFEKMRHAARELVDTRYDWKVIGDEMNRVIEDLIQQHGQASNSKGTVPARVSEDSMRNRTGAKRLSANDKGFVLGYMKQLDSLRAFAVFAVMISHFVPKKYAFATKIPWGTIGVQLFFVLSGFLITGILLVCRENSHTLGGSFLGMRQFYIRRFVRIFPLYYFVLCVAFVLNIANIRETIIWYAFYLSNVMFSIHRHWAGSLSHFWSLAVEEQFYLFWPFVILFSPRRILPYAAIVTVLVAPLSRWILFNQGNEVAVGILMPSNLDTLGLGALLALMGKGYFKCPLVNHRFIVGIGAVGGIVALGLQISLIEGRAGPIGEIFLTSFLGLFFFWLIYQASHGFGGIVGSMLGADSVAYLGKISYGIYVYHNFVPSFVQNHVDPLINLPSPYRGMLEVFLSVGITLLIASLSWHILEKPLNDLRRYFNYARNTSGLVGKGV